MRREPPPSYERWGSAPEGFVLQVMLVGLSSFGGVEGRGPRVAAIYISVGRHGGLQKPMAGEYFGFVDVCRCWD